MCLFAQCSVSPFPITPLFLGKPLPTPPYLRGTVGAEDVANVSNFVRKVKYASVKPVPSPSSDYAGSEYYRVCVFEVSWVTRGGR